jgi:hypothetical protein
MPPRRGPTKPGTRKRPAEDSRAVTSEEQRLDQEQRERRRLLTQSLPPSWRTRVRALQGAGITGPEALEVDYAVTAAARERYIAAYEADARAEADRRKQAARLLKAVAHLGAEDETRLKSESLARDLMTARVDHARAMQIIAVLTQAARQAQDSLAVQRPSTHTRVRVEVIGGSVHSGDVPTYVDVRTDEDAALLREIEGTTTTAEVDP